MRNSTALLIFTLIGLLFSFNLQSQENQLIAHYPLNNSKQDLINNQALIRTVNTIFKDEGAYCNGTYGDYDKNDGVMITTPTLTKLNLASFSISIDFKADEYKTMPVFVLGQSCRLLNFLLNKDGKIILAGNNAEILQETELTYQPNQWHNALITYEQNETKIYLDGKLGGTASIAFSKSCLNEWRYGNLDISTTNFSNGSCFKGYWRNVKVYNGVVSPEPNPNPNNPSRILAEVVWESPNNQSLSVNSTAYTLKACIKSTSAISQIQLFLNDNPIKDNSMRGFLIVSADDCKQRFEKAITLKTGKNEIRLEITNSAGKMTSQTVIYAKIPPPPPPIVKNNFNQNLQKNILNTGNAKPFKKTSSYESYGVLISPTKQNGAWLSWVDEQENTHVSLINEQSQKTSDVIVASKGTKLYALTNDNNGFAVLLERKNNKMSWGYLAKFTAQGQKVFENKLIGDINFDKEGNRAFDNWSTPRLAFNDSEYIAYFANSRRWDDGVVHQGDILMFIDEKGNIIEKRPNRENSNGYVNTNGWNWGTSHSFEQRLMYDGLYIHTLAKGDAYPRGIAYQRILSDLKTTKTVKTSSKSNVFPLSGTIGDNFVPLGLGGLVSASENGAWVASFVSNEARKSYDVGFLAMDDNMEVKQIWLTNTPDLDEHNTYITKYGDNFLVVWTSLDISNPKPESVEDKFIGAIVDKAGNFVLKPFDLASHFQRKKILKEFKWESFQKSYADCYEISNDFINFSNGDIGWVLQNSETQEIEIVRVKVK